MTDRLDELWQKVKYLEDQVREEVKKRLALEAELSEIVSQLSAHTKDTSQAFYRLGEIHGVASREIGELKLRIQEINQQLGTMQDQFHQHMINYST